MALSSLLPLPSITAVSNKLLPAAAAAAATQPSMAALEEVKRKVANSISIKEFTDVRALLFTRRVSHYNVQLLRWA